MKKFIFYAIFLSVYVFSVISKVYCQNLVPNPSFEDTIACPVFANQLNNCANWWASRGSPDYFNECDFITQNTSVPYNFLGFQYAQDGNAYIGFITYYRPSPNEREFATSALLSPMVVGLKYKISFYVSLADALYRLASNKIGVFFSTSNYNLSSPLPINNFAHFYSDSIVSDTMNWVFIHGEFIADSMYTHVTIGNFFDDNNTDTIYNPPVSQSYYYLDNIKIEPDSTSSLNNIVPNLQIQLFPNPTNGLLRIENYINEIQKIEFHDVKGREFSVNSIKNFDSYKELDISNLDSGLYIATIKCKNNFYYFKICKL